MSDDDQKEQGSKPNPSVIAFPHSRVLPQPADKSFKDLGKGNMGDKYGLPRNNYPAIGARAAKESGLDIYSKSNAQNVGIAKVKRLSARLVIMLFAIPLQSKFASPVISKKHSCRKLVKVLFLLSIHPLQKKTTTTVNLLGLLKSPIRLVCKASAVAHITNEEEKYGQFVVASRRSLFRKYNVISKCRGAERG
ncbi:MAG: hypothetical protein JKY25_13450 [Robiginitomaculum sp.]|nr:hypothetical protein [Robiginitomaculum sp.]